jgi:hypothetical protein
MENSGWIGFGQTLIPIDDSHTLPIKSWVENEYRLLPLGKPISYPLTTYGAMLSYHQLLICHVTRPILLAYVMRIILLFLNLYNFHVLIYLLFSWEK